MVGSFYGIFKNLPSRIKRKMTLNSSIIEHVTRVTWGIESASDCLNTIARQLNLPDLQLSEIESKTLIMEIVKFLFYESFPGKSKRKEEPLGDLAINLVTHLTGIVNPAMMDLLENPLLHSYGSIEQMYLDILQYSAYHELLPVEE